MNYPDRPDEKFSPRIGALGTLGAVTTAFILACKMLVSLPGRWPGAATIGVGPFAGLHARWRDARIERAELLHLTDRELGDIGLNRLDVRQLIDANWWQDPEVLGPRVKRRRR